MTMKKIESTMWKTFKNFFFIQNSRVDCLQCTQKNCKQTLVIDYSVQSTPLVQQTLCSTSLKFIWNTIDVIFNKKKCRSYLAIYMNIFTVKLMYNRIIVWKIKEFFLIFFFVWLNTKNQKQALKNNIGQARYDSVTHTQNWLSIYIKVT